MFGPYSVFARSSVLLIWMLTVPSSSHAADRFWGSFFGGTFSDPTKWQGNIVAGAGDVAHFGLTANPFAQRIYAVDFIADATNQALVIEDDFVTFDLAGRTYTTNVFETTAHTAIGTVPGRSGRLTITDGIWGARHVFIGDPAGSSGTLTISTAGQLIPDLPTLPLNVYIGNFGTGTLTIENGGHVDGGFGRTSIGNQTGATGTATVTGAGSVLDTGDMIVGGVGTGTLNIMAGGVVDASGFIGGSGGVGTANVDGTGSQWISSGLAIGDRGSGTLNITAGGHVESNFGHVGQFFGSTGVVNVAGGGSQWTNSQLLFIAGDGQGTLNITAGGRVQSQSGFVGNNTFLSGGTGEVNVDGAGSQWINSGGAGENTLFIGDDGVGRLNITSGGLVQSGLTLVGSGSALFSGTANVDGANSQLINSSFLSVGGFGPGTLTITAGGRAQNSSGSVGDNGEVNVTGAGSEWINSNLLIVTGRVSSTLNITDGGSVSSTVGFIADGSPTDTGTVNVTGAGSIWTNSDTMDIGSRGIGTLNISGGGSVTSTSSVIGRFAGSNGTASIDGAGSTWNNSVLLSVENVGTGTLTIEAGGQVSSTTGLVGGNLSGSGTATATVTGTGSNWTIAENLAVGVGGTLDIQPGGTVNVVQDTEISPGGLVKLAGGTLDTSEVSFQGGGQFQWTSGTLHVGIYNGDLTNPNGGTLAPGHSAGDTLILGNYTQLTGGTMEIEIGGVGQGSQYDFINITGTALVDGLLQLSLINGFVASAAQSFVVLNSASLLGVFDNAGNGQRVTTSDGGGSFLVNYGPSSSFNLNQVVLSAFEAVLLPGDYNDNGTVDAGDYVVWRDTLGQTGTGLPADGNGNNQIDNDDYNIWRAHFGQTAGSGSGADVNAPVPEPTSAVLLILGAAVGTWMRRRVASRVPLTRWA